MNEPGKETGPAAAPAHFLASASPCQKISALAPRHPSQLFVAWISVFFTFICSGALAGEMPKDYTPPKISEGLTAIKSLEGKWQGTVRDKGQEEKSATVEYHVTSGGTAVEEKIFTGTPHEMVSVYHDIAGKLNMTHYCMLGNQPQLELKEGAPSKWILAETPASASLLGGQMRMSNLTLEMPDANTLIQTWTGAGSDGKTQDPTVVDLKRVS